MLAWQKIYDRSEEYSQHFDKAVTKPAETQWALLQRMLNANKTTKFGLTHNFSDIKSVKSFQNEVPIQNYQSLKPYIDEIFHDSADSLSCESTLFFEKTSGSTQAAKYIPYNQRTFEDFQHAIFPWLHNLISEIPSIMDGSCYWSISPAGREAEQSPSGIPIGISNDALYFGSQTAQHIQETLSVPFWVSQIESIEAWKYISLRFLLCDRNLRLISIWSPTFLLQFINTLLHEDYSNNMCSDIAGGSIAFEELQRFKSDPIFKPQEHRASVLAEAISIDSNGKKQINTKLLWPDLKLISCWSDASSHIYSQQLQNIFPEVLIQAKGLLATEGAITLPLLSIKNTVLSVNSGFYEFVANDGSIRLCEELTVGETYSVLLTNSSGLYRYDIGDLVTVTAWHEKTPCLRFDGRMGSNTDLCGEKFTESFVLPHLNKINGFTMLVPYQSHDDYDKPEHKPYYRLYVDAEFVSETAKHSITQHLETALSTNPHYAYARKIGQLNPLRVFRCKAPLQDYEQACLEKGIIHGNIKSTCLSPEQHWHSCFSFAEDTHKNESLTKS